MSLGRDFRIALRSLTAQPGFTLVAVVTIALGIGANTAIFSVVNAVLLRPLPYAQAHELFMIWETIPEAGETEGFVSYPDFRDWKEQSTTFAELTAFWAFPNGNVNLTGGLEPERVPVERVMAGYFELLGIPPLHGRTFRPEENVVGNHRVAILSYALWQRQFGGDPALVGGSVNVNGFPYAVVGIMPPEFHPLGTLALGDDVELWRPLAPDDNQTGGRGARNLRVVGRLAAGVSQAQAQRELDRIAEQLAMSYPETNEKTGVRLVPLQDQVVQGVRPALLMLLATVGVVLLIASTNVANLFLVKAAATSRQIAIRVALGAPRSRIIMQLLTESMVVSVIGGVAGVLLAFWGVEALVLLGPAEIPMLADVHIDTTVLVFTALVAVGTGLAFGLWPAVRFSRPDLGDSLREAGRPASITGDRRVADVLVISEVAFAMVLLVAAGLLIRSFGQLLRVEPGFDPENVLTLQLELPMATTYPSQESRSAFVAEMLERMRGLPEVASASITNAPPMGEGGFNTSYTISGRAELSVSGDLRADLQTAEPSYFETLGIPLLRGRMFTVDDDGSGPPVAIVNQTMVDALWPGESPLGERIRLSFGLEAEIVGVVGDVHLEGLDVELAHTVYWPSEQFPYNFMTVVLKTLTPPRVVAPAVRRLIRNMDGNLPVYNVATMNDLVSQSVAQRRFQMLLVGAFSSLAALLAVVGIYGVVSYSVSQRTNELGLRMALGAHASDVLKLILSQGVKLIGLGIVSGGVTAMLLGGFLRTFLFGVGRTDVATYVAVAFVLGGAGMLATYLPARRAANVDPMIALRAE